MVKQTKTIETVWLTEYVAQFRAVASGTATCLPTVKLRHKDGLHLEITYNLSYNGKVVPQLEADARAIGQSDAIAFLRLHGESLVALISDLHTWRTKITAMLAASQRPEDGEPASKKPNI